MNKPKFNKISADGEKGSGRRQYLDWIRMTATVFVIGIHTVSLAASLVPAQSVQYRILTILVFTFVSCNLIFIMTSGALLLPVEGEKAGTFYAKRFIKVAVPLVIYYVLYICAKEGIAAIYPKNLPKLFVRILAGAPVEAPHFWLVYVILTLYVITPFLRYLLRSIPEGVFYGLLVVLFVISTFSTVAPFFGGEKVLSVIADSYVGVFLFGYFLSEKCNKKASSVITVLGVFYYFIVCILILFTSGYEPYIYENSPVMIFFSAAVFLFIKNLPYKGETPCVVRLICRHSYSILLIHWGVLHFVVKQILHVNVLSGGIIGGCILMAVLTFLFSLLGAVILDYTLIAWSLKLFRIILKQH